MRSIFQPLEARYTFHITCNPEHEQAGEMIDFLNDIASLTHCPAQVASQTKPCWEGGFKVSGAAVLAVVIKEKWELGRKEWGVIV